LIDAPNSLAIVFYSFLALDIPIKPRGVPRRILIFSVCLTGALLYWSYSACLVSFLTAEKIIFPITSLSVSFSISEMPLHNTVKLGYNELGYNELGYNEHSVITNTRL